MQEVGTIDDARQLHRVVVCYALLSRDAEASCADRWPS
jgi:hypothetical protein